MRTPSASSTTATTSACSASPRAATSIDLAQQPAFRAALFEQVQTLDYARRATLLLHHQEGFAVEAIAQITGCPVGTVKSRLHHATRLLVARTQGISPARTEGEQAPLSSREEG